MKIITDGKQYLPADDPREKLYLNRSMEAYLKADDRDETFFLIGPKGTGKTTLLRQKSYNYRNRPGVKFNANERELIEYVAFYPGYFSRENLLEYNKLSLWESIWRHCLRVMALRIADPEDLSVEVRKLIEKTDSITALLQDLLSSRTEVFRTLRKYEGILAREIRRIQSGVAIFIDNVDQSFDQILREYSFYDEDIEGDKKNIPVELWVNAQNGLLIAAYHLNCLNSHIKVFATCRREAYVLMPGSVKQNLNNYCLLLEYTKDAIYEIMEKKLEEMGYEKAGNKSPLTQFVGMEKRPHPIAIDPLTGNHIEEDFFSYLYRHTFGRPREIVELLKELNDRLVSSGNFERMPEKLKLDEIRNIVNATSHNFFKNYQGEIIPYFSKAKLHKFVSTLKTNYITRGELDNFDYKTLKAYYSYGLLGYTVERDGGLFQSFQTAAKYNYETLDDLPNAKYYLIHSALDQTIIDIRGYREHHNPINIIGDNYPFIEPLESYDCDFFTPNKIVRNRWECGNKNYKHQLPLKEYYEKFIFNNPETVRRLEKDAFDAFLEVACFYALALLENKFPGNYGDAKYKHEKSIFKSQKIRRKYQAMLDECTEECKIKFYNRLFGRCMVAATCLLLDWDVCQIHALLVEGDSNCFQMDFVSESKENGQYQYLVKAFFLEGFKIHNGRSEKHLLFESLSPFEQRWIKKCKKDVVEKISDHIDVKTDEHRKWLLNRFESDAFDYFN